jgi:hypothetical protein
MGLNRVPANGAISMLLRLRRFGFLAALVAIAGLRTTVVAAQPAADDDDSDDSEQTPAAGKSAAAIPADKPARTSETKPVVTDAPTPAPVAVSAETTHGPPPSPLTFRSDGWAASIYGFAELDVMGDSTQSYAEGSGSSTLARPNTVAGDNPRTQMSARNSRLGFKIEAPEWDSVKASAVIEMDFFGTQAPTTSQNSFYTDGPVRMRHFYAKLETPVFDVLAGQYHDLFAWGGAGFYPNSVGFLPLFGEIYHRNPQFRISKTLRSQPVDFEIAVAAVRPVQRDAVAPDVQGGIKVDINGWTGAATPGASRPVAAPLSIGLSGVGRRLSVTDFSPTPANPQTGTAWGFAANAFLPIIPASGGDLKNALSVTGEYTTGSGISDLYTNLTGGVAFPALPNPNNVEVVPTYAPNIDPGIVTFDSANRLQAIKWSGVVVNAHYHLPIADGKKLWLSGTYSMLKSSNALSLTPAAGRPFVWDKGQYFDVNLWWGVTPAVQIGLSYQRTQQTFGDATTAHNNRGEGAFYFFF